MRYFFLFLLLIALIYSCNRDTADVANTNASSTFLAPAAAPRTPGNNDEELGKADLSPDSGYDRAKDAAPADELPPAIGDPQQAKRISPIRTTSAPNRDQTKYSAVEPSQRVEVKRSVPEPGISVQAIKEPAIFEVAKSDCSGNCKDFSLALHEGGLLVLNGKRNVRHEGLSTQQMMGFKYGDLVKEFQTLIVAGLADAYPENEGVDADLPATILRYTFANGKEKTVRVFDLDAAPEPLAAFLEKTEKMVESGIWDKARE